MEFLALVAFVAIIAGAVYMVRRKTKLKATVPPRSANPMSAQWQIGPVISGNSRSVNMPRTPYRSDAGLFFDFPHPAWSAGHVHAMTFNHGPLKGKRRLVAQYRIVAAPDVQFITDTSTPYGLITPYFQREGDDWQAAGDTEDYRWYGTPVSAPLIAGTHELVIAFDAEWTATQTSSRTDNPEGFKDALDHAESVGFVFGGGSGYGHGVCATGPARFVLTGFRVE